MGRSLPLKLVFAGTSEFAVPALRTLLSAGYDLGAVITRPDRPAGRGRRPRPSPVRGAAEALGLPVRTPERLHDPGELAALAALEPDWLVVAAYGRILRPAVLALPRHGCLNLHASLLPRWRGAAPVAHALLAGDPRTGVTLMRMDEGLDTGPMLARVETSIEEEDDRGRLTARLAEMAARLLVESLPAASEGRLGEEPQDPALATLAPPLRAADGALDWRLPADAIERRVRAFTPEPGAFTTVGGRRLLVRRVRAASPPVPLAPGEVGAPAPGQGVPIGCGAGTAARLLRVQPAGGREMDAEAAARGRHLPQGAVLGEAPR